MKISEKKKLKKFFWALPVIAAIFILIILLLLYKPPGSSPPAVIEEEYISDYLTNVLSPKFYNGLGSRQPFELDVSQKGINHTITHSEWPKETDGVRFFAPNVFFVPGNIVLIGTIVLNGLELVVTVVVEPSLDSQGLLNLKVKHVKVGALTITTIAKLIAEKIYKKQTGEEKGDKNDLETQIAASLLNNKPFEPIFEFDKKKVRINKITLEQKQLTVSFVPVAN